MTQIRAGRLLPYLLGATLLAHAAPARAGGFGLDAFSAKAIGLSGAGVASGSAGVPSLYLNPAAVTLLPGKNGQYTLTFIDPSARITPGAGTSPFLGRQDSGELGLTALVPSTASSYQLTDRLWAGFATAVPYASTTKPDHDWAGQIYSRTSRVRSYSFSPTIGYKVNDWLAVGAGLNVEFFQARLKKATSFLPGAPTASVRADDIAVGYTLGAVITPAEGTVIGIGYRSSVAHVLEGKLNTGTTVIPVKAKLNTPDRLTVGLSQALANDLRLHLGYEWTNWSRLGTVAYIGPAGLPVASLPFRYRNGHLISVGAEYDVNDVLTVRGGLGYEVSPVTEAVRSTSIPDSNRFHLSAGLSYRLSEKASLDLAYRHVFFEGSKVRIAPGNPHLVTAALPGRGATDLPFAGDVQAEANLVSVSFRYRFD